MVAINNFIGIKGKSNVGKTTTIDWCFLNILEESQLKSIKYFEHGDFVAVVEFKDQIIVFVSAGDIERVAKQNYKILCERYQGEIDVCVFAAKTRGKVVEFWKNILKENSKDKFDKIFKMKRQDEDKKKWIEKISRKLYELIKEFVEEKNNKRAIMVTLSDK